MAKTYLERRIVKSGIELCEDRIRMKGTTISADDLRGMTVRTLSPAGQVVYSVIGVVIVGLALWIHSEITNMALSVMVLLMGFSNFLYAIHGRPKTVAVLGDSVDLMDLTAEIVNEFVKQADSRIESKER